MERELSREAFATERKTIEVSLHENEGGRFLRLSEVTRGRTSTIIIPVAALQVAMESQPGGAA